MDASRDVLFLFSPNEQRGGGKRALPDFIFIFSPVQQTTSGIGHRVEYFFSGSQPHNALNVRNSNHPRYYVLQWLCWVMIGGCAR